jgi:hypothetical protein
VAFSCKRRGICPFVRGTAHGGKCRLAVRSDGRVHLCDAESYATGGSE